MGGSASRLDSRINFYPKTFMTARLDALILTFRRRGVHCFRHSISWTPVVRLRFMYTSITRRRYTDFRSGPTATAIVRRQCFPYGTFLLIFFVSFGPDSWGSISLALSHPIRLVLSQPRRARIPLSIPHLIRPTPFRSSRLRSSSQLPAVLLYP